ncbi:MAG: hypothetical protein U1E76_09795 [Planctomycetota bacterium]
MLKDEAVLLGMKMFRTIKLNGEQITKDHPLADALGGAKLPRFVFVSREGKVVGKMEGRMAANNLFTVMKRAAAADYRTDMDRMVKEARSFLTALDKVENGKKNLQTKRDSEMRKAGSKLNPFQDAQFKKEAAALAADEKKLLDQEKTLFQFELKDSKPVAEATAVK